MSFRIYNAVKQPHELRERLWKFKGGQLELRCGKEVWRGPIYLWFIKANTVTIWFKWCLTRQIDEPMWQPYIGRHHRPQVSLEILKFKQDGIPKQLHFETQRNTGTFFQRDDPSNLKPPTAEEDT